jgi:hypothetical protein
VPEHLRGRVFSVDQLGAYALQPISLALTPEAVTAWGITATAATGALALILTWPWRRKMQDSRERVNSLGAARHRSCRRL